MAKKKESAKQESKPQVSAQAKEDSKWMKDLKFQLHYGSRSIIVWIFFLYLVMNVWMSQAVPPLYSRFAEERKDAIVSFLQDMRKQPQFQMLLTMQQRIYGESLIDDVNAEEIRRRKSVIELETLHKNYPKNRDILISLYTVHNALGEKEKAQQYFEMARAIDPAVK